LSEESSKQPRILQGWDELRVSLQADRFRMIVSRICGPYKRDGGILLMPVRDGFPTNDRANVGSPFLPAATTRRATGDLAYARNEQAREIVACEPRSPQPLGVWS
jgi:hypothetical protein